MVHDLAKCSFFMLNLLINDLEEAVSKGLKLQYVICLVNNLILLNLFLPRWSLYVLSIIVLCFWIVSHVHKFVYCVWSGIYSIYFGPFCKNRSIGPELTTAKTGPIHLSSFVEIAFVDWFTKLLLINISIYMNI